MVHFYNIIKIFNFNYNIMCSDFLIIIGIIRNVKKKDKHLVLTIKCFFGYLDQLSFNTLAQQKLCFNKTNTFLEKQNFTVVFYLTS